MRDSIIEIIRKYCGDEAAERVLINRRKHEEFFLNLPHTPGEEQTSPLGLELIDIHMILSVARDYLDNELLYHLIYDIGLDCLRNDQRNLARDTFSFLIELQETSLNVRLDSILQRADILLKYNEWEKSLGDLNKALSIALDSNEKGKASKAHNLLAIWYFENGDVPTGLTHLNEALSLNKEIDDLEAQKTITLHLAIFNHMVGNLKEAKEYCDQLLDSKNELFLSKVYHILSIIQRDSGQFDEGYSSACQALDKALAISNTYQEACIRLTRSEIEILREKYENAREDLQISYKTFHKEGDKLGVSDTYRVFGIFNIKRKEYKLAGSNLNISLDISRSYNNIHSIGEIYIAKALLAKEVGDTAALDGSLDNARSYFEKIGAGKRVDFELKKWNI